ncbi:S66 family peptidase [Bacillus wiedmannii]|uniref:S66 family peptidase n=1 Tax=Bacillus wiedmannii TaxID=1890302 RepID=UPI000BECCBBA|nr:S66 peptidase family protein [Bacillus wiedmannii]PEF38681.1 LD-carboxypeptidase [Bacillus wiedmannii]
MINTILPPPIKRGDTLALFSPSSPGERKFPLQYEYGKKMLRKMGYRLIDTYNKSETSDYRSSSPKNRSEQIHKLMKDNSVKGILCNIGGYNTIEMLPYLDFDLIKSHPKFICGYSDSSVLLNAIFYRSHLVTFHGPMVISSFGEYPAPFDFTVEQFQYMAQQTIQTPYNFPNPDVWTDEFIDWTGPNWGTQTKTLHQNLGPKWIYKSQEPKQGILVGGNTDSLLNIINTEFLEIPYGSILFIEDTSVSLERWAMLIWALKIRGIFQRINGLLIGKIEGMPAVTKSKMKNIILEIAEIENLDIPIVAELDIGHTAPMLCLPIGSIIKLDSNNESLILQKLCTTLDRRH